MKITFGFVIILLLIVGLKIIFTSTLPFYGQGLEVPLLVSLLVGGFILYGAYILWREIYPSS